MLEQVLWYFNSQGEAPALTPLFRAAIVCGLLYQLDLAMVLGFWLLRRLRVIERDCRLEPERRVPAMLVLPTLLRERTDLDGLQRAALSAAHNGYPAPLTIVLCIDGRDERPELCDELTRWTERTRLPGGVRMYVATSAARAGKAIAMESGLHFVQGLVAKGVLPMLPEVFFNMDADSTLGKRALERMAHHLLRQRWIAQAPHMIVTSNVVVPIEQCFDSRGRIDWLTMSVAREYLSSITYSKFNWKIFPCTEVSGALYCTWTSIHVAAPYYARYMQTLRFRDWLAWWFGAAPPRFSDFRGAALPEALSGPGDDTWLAWLCCIATCKDSQLRFDPPRTPLHALLRLLLAYVSRPVTYDPLAKVFTKTPSTAKVLFKQRLRWNSSQILDMKRWTRALLYHWQLGLTQYLGTAGLIAFVGACFVGLFALLSGAPSALGSAPYVLLLGIGYAATRVTSTVAALIVSESARADWLKLLALPLAGPFHLVFNTTTLCVGYLRDIVGFGEPTTFAPESTLKRSKLSRIALAYRLRRACLLAVRAIRYGDVPWGAFWLGWRETPWTPSGFEGWTSGKKPPAVYWPEARESSKHRGDR